MSGDGFKSSWLREALGLPDGSTPFPWQEELLSRFAKGSIERSVDIPTGLGKTAVMAIWLVARALGAPLPRRLVYVVDRRAVVDQTTDVARELRAWVDRMPEVKQSLGLGTRSLPISTLRGQYVDNREWLEDPASSAIVIGTVDMIGSRLLFEGYATSRKMRPYHAGLVGVDTLVVLDEAHLVPPFECLLDSIATGTALFGPEDEGLRKLLPPFKLMALSATGTAHWGTSFGLQPADVDHPIVLRRLHAAKRLSIQPLEGGDALLAEALANRVWSLTEEGKAPVRCIVFCDAREDAKSAMVALEKLARNAKQAVDTELFVGARRVFEREDAATRLKELGFIASTSTVRGRPAFLFATSAGEVGVDLDADHMVSDLVSWERMVQRLGRVNRRGNGSASVVVFKLQPKRKSAVERALAKKPADRDERDVRAITAYEADVERENAWAKPFDYLPGVDGALDASPAAIRELKQKSEGDPDLRKILAGATTATPLRPALTRPLVDAWSMTSLEEHTGRPAIAPWLRGWLEDEPPQTTVLWRVHLPTRTCGNERVPVAKKEVELFFEAAPPHASEMLETETFRIIDWLMSRAIILISKSDGGHLTPSGEGGTGRPTPLLRSDVAAVVLKSDGEVSDVLRLGDFLSLDDTDGRKKLRAKLNQTLAGATLVVDARLGGLSRGLLDDEENRPPRCADDGRPWMDVISGGRMAPVVRFRVHAVEANRPFSMNAEWRERLRFATEISSDGEPKRWLIVEKWLHDAATEEDRSAARPQLLEEHQSWAEERARNLASRLRLPDAYAETLAIAARLHDEGKRARRWQLAFNAPDNGVYAKTRGPINYLLLDGYRHELGSLPVAEKDEGFLRLPDDLRDLALHLIIAHHGFGRPVIRTSGCDDPPSALDERTRAISLRFTRLQARWGPWGLAWWEALLRAADQQASRDNDAADATGGDV
jgi:CRISPR-associated endonuclease/helicase Cas3